MNEVFSLISTSYHCRHRLSEKTNKLEKKLQGLALHQV